MEGHRVYMELEYVEGSTSAVDSVFWKNGKEVKLTVSSCYDLLNNPSEGRMQKP